MLGGKWRDGLLSRRLTNNETAPKIKTGALYSRKYNAPRVRRTPTHTIQS
jgi:hypothetical protein